MQRLWLPWMRMYLIRPMEAVPCRQVILRYPLPEELQPYPVLHQPVFLAVDKPIHWELVYREHLVEQKSSKCLQLTMVFMMVLEMNPVQPKAITPSV